MKARGSTAQGTAFLPAENPIARLPAARRVLVIGGGVAGLTAAHELAERGFEVTVVERRAWGGKSRSIPVPGSAVAGRSPLPGEHGYRFVPGFYRHLPDTMARIPSLDDGRSVWDHMVAQSGVRYARIGGREDPVVLSHRAGAVDRGFTRRQLRAWSQQMRHLGVGRYLGFCRRFLVFATSSDERRFGEWEHTTWWDFVNAEAQGPEFQKVLVDGVSQHLVAARGDLASTRSIGTLGEAYVYAALRLSTTGENGVVLDAPSSEAWIDPWVAHLGSLGAVCLLGVSVDAIEFSDGRVSAVTVSGPGAAARRIEADWFVCATAVSEARTLLDDDVLAVDPSLAGLRELRTEWMNGIQFFLTRPVPVINGPVDYIDSPWALVSGSQAQWWKRDLAAYGDGTVREVLSVNISNFTSPGVLFGKPARECSPQEMAAEVLAQVRQALDVPGRPSIIPDDIVHSWFLDPALRMDGGVMVNDEPLIVSYAGSWNARPTATTKVPNLFLAGDYVRDNLSCATMESANQTGRLAANGVLEASGATAAPARIFSLYQPPGIGMLKRLDRARFRRGLAHILDRRDRSGSPDAPA